MTKEKPYQVKEQMYKTDKPLPMYQINLAFEAGCDNGWAMELVSKRRAHQVFIPEFDRWKAREFQEMAGVPPDSHLIAQQLRREEGYDKLILRREASPSDPRYPNMAVWETGEGDYIAVQQIDGVNFAVDTGFYFE